MELKEYFEIIKKYKKLFIQIFLGVIVLVFLYFYFQPVSYQASLSLNITRAGQQETQGYKYDNFYRLQADQMFADTLVEWAKSPRFETDIYPGSSRRKAEKRSSQLVEISFSAPDETSAQKISASIVETLSGYTQELNRDQKESSWFQLVTKKPVVAKHTPNYGKIFLVTLLVGIFLAFWSVLIKHYLE